MFHRWPYPLWIAHRGAGRLAPENTLAAMRLGAQHGYRMFECDVKLSADGVPFLLHDATLERTTNGHGTGGDSAWAELSRLDAGSWHSRAYAGEPLPTLESVARWCIANSYFLNIEIKPTPGLDEKTGRVVAEHAALLWRGQSVQPFLSSFRPEALAGARAAAPHIPRGLLVESMWDDCLDRAQELGCAALVCNHTLWDAHLVQEAHLMGLRALSYTVNDEWATHRLMQLGTDGIITDRVDLFSPASRNETIAVNPATGARRQPPLP